MTNKVVLLAAQTAQSMISGRKLNARGETKIRHRGEPFEQPRWSSGHANVYVWRETWAMRFGARDVLLEYYLHTDRWYKYLEIDASKEKLGWYWVNVAAPANDQG